MIYRKQGSVVRWENGTVVRVTESGVAMEEGEAFICYPERPSSENAKFNVILSRRDLPASEEHDGEGPSSGQPSGSDFGGRSFAAMFPLRGEVPAAQDDIESTAASVVRVLPRTLTLERLILTHGIAHHQYGDRTWFDKTRRLHLALVKDGTRVLIDQTDFDTTQITRIASALSRAEAKDQDPPPRLRLAPNVTAALLPALVNLAPPNVRILQTKGGIDGKGNDIVEAAGEWPNWYRPSYRVRPVRAPLNLRIECDVTAIEPDRPVAIALLAPVTGPVLKVLIEEGERVYPATVRVTRIDAVAGERILYPYGGGSFGAEMML